ncbi:MAG: hypothetical protein PUF33_01225 [Solobacterium sp.]|nr:hypothetical protein [Solobacterium sp.]MDD6121248.1 hypothetical protein [Solobacterium sp.]MDD6496960.1 hypothetical protein [Solobacterium sp.]
MFRKVLLSVAIMFGIFTASVFAEESPYVAPCGNCGNISVVVIHDYEWSHHENSACIHGYSAGYDEIYFKVARTYRKCTQCGWTGSISYENTGINKRVCKGHN